MMQGASESPSRMDAPDRGYIGNYPTTLLSTIPSKALSKPNATLSGTKVS